MHIYICTHVPLKSIHGVDPISRFGSADIQRNDEPILPDCPLCVLLPGLPSRRDGPIPFSRYAHTHVHTHKTGPNTYYSCEHEERDANARARAPARVAGVCRSFFSPPLRAYVTLRNARTSLPVAAHLGGKRTRTSRRTLLTVAHFTAIACIACPLVSVFTSLDPPDQRLLPVYPIYIDVTYAAR